eukprot:2355416-Prymnesium_polylepis.1
MVAAAVSCRRAVVLVMGTQPWFYSMCAMMHDHGRRYCVQQSSQRPACVMREGGLSPWFSRVCLCYSSSVRLYYLLESARSDEKSPKPGGRRGRGQVDDGVLSRRADHADAAAVWADSPQA